MGTRIHKILGYGIATGVDNRIRDDLWENQTPGEVATLINTEAHKARAEKRAGYHSLAFEGHFDDRKYPSVFSDIVEYADHPDSDTGWWVIVPPMQWKSWRRYDSSLDYYECYDDKDDDPLRTVVKQFDVPLYPYLSWMRRETGEVISNYSRIHDGADPQIVPYVPEVVKLIAEHLHMPDWKLFRPVLIRWWC
jgi:hypothetical protein